MNIDLSSLKSKGIDYAVNSILANYTTFRVGGRAPAVIHCRNAGQLKNTVSLLNEQGVPFIVIGEGSNILVSDRGLDCAVVRYFHDKPDIALDGSTVRVAGCTRVSDLAHFCAQNGLDGLVFLSGIPGTVGGAVAGNAGAFGRQIADRLRTVTLMNKNRALRTASPQELNFSYRDSSLKNGSDIVVEAVFELMPADKIHTVKEREKILSERKQKHPDYRLVPCAGCVFRNVTADSGPNERQSVGKVLEQSGAMGLTCGGAAVFRKHANIIVNKGSAKADDIYTLMQMMKRRLKEKAGLDARQEIICLGEFQDKSSSLPS